MKVPRMPLGEASSGATNILNTNDIPDIKSTQNSDPIMIKLRSPSKLTMPSHKASLRQRTESQQINKQKLSMRDFEVGKKLGRGKFGRVLLVKHRQSGFIVALKTMKKDELVKYRAETQFRREIEIQASLSHPNILKIYGHFEDTRKVYIMVEFAPKGEMFRLLNEVGRFSPVLASDYITQVASGLNYCHQHNIIHRDIKPENLLMGCDGKVKIADFGWSIKSRHQRNTLCGTLDYLPPEMVSKQLHSHYVDIWSLGVLTYEFLTGEAPFFAADKDKTYQRINGVDLKFPEYLESEAMEFVRLLLQRDPMDRMKLKDVPSHPWIQKHQPQWEKNK